MKYNPAGNIDKYYKESMNALINKCIDNGMDKFPVHSIIEEKAVCCNDLQYVNYALSLGDGYVNPLIMRKQRE